MHVQKFRFTKGYLGMFFFLNPVWCKEIGSKQEEITKTSTTYKPCLLFQTGN